MVVTRQELPALEGGPPSRFLVFGSPKLGNEEIEEVVDSIKTGWLGTGPKVSLFEKKVRGYVRTKYSKALSSCTAGLHLSLLAIGVKRGDEVITAPLTFAATANVVEHVGATPVFADIELPSQNIDPNEIEKKITSKTKAIIPVHMAGRPCDMRAIMRIAKRHKLKVIEDAAHAFGAEYRGRKCGSIGDIGVFSFYVTKNLITGEGGMITTNNKQYSDFIELYALHGLSSGAWKRYSDEGFKHYLVQVPGYKYNMMDLQAAIGIHQFNRFEDGQIRRKEIWQKYNEAFSDLPIELPAEIESGTTHAYHLYTILINSSKLKADRETIQQALHAEGIGIGVHFISLHLHPYYKKKYGFKVDDFPNSAYVSERTISLPFSAKLTDIDVKDVIKAVRKVITYYVSNEPKPLKVQLPRAAEEIKSK